MKWHGCHQRHTGLAATIEIYNGVMGYMYEARVYWGILVGSGLWDYRVGFRVWGLDLRVYMGV